jgi:predicted nucleic acid-binding protein
MLEPAIAKYLLLDTGFWVAVYEERDPNYHRAGGLLSDVSRTTILLPWPILYEVLRTRFVRRNDRVARFRSDLTRLRIEKINDAPYRESALSDALGGPGVRSRGLSLVDLVLRRILEDPQLRVDGLVTFDVQHFQDVCRRRRIPVVP